MDLIKNWKLHLLALIVVIVAESIGMHRFGLVVLLPLLYALVLGGILSFPKFGILKFSEMDRAAKFMPIAMLVLLTKIGLGIGPNLEMLLNSGWALIMQEFGHFFGTLIFGLPVALLLGMKREAIGACYSIDREPNVAIIGEKYGLEVDPAAVVYELSMGERQRVEIIRALMTNPKLLILDEPTSVLVPQAVRKLFVTLHRLAEEGVSILFISHNLHVVRKLCTRVAVMEKGRIVETGPVDQIFFHPQAPYTQRLIAAIPTRRKL